AFRFHGFTNCLPFSGFGGSGGGGSWPHTSRLRCRPGRMRACAHVTVVSQPGTIKNRLAGLNAPTGDQRTLVVLGVHVVPLARPHEPARGKEHPFTIEPLITHALFDLHFDGCFALALARAL